MKALKELDPRWIAGTLVLLVSLWLLSGLAGAPAIEDDGADAIDAAPLRVMVRDSLARDLVREATVSAVTEPMRMVRLRAEISGRVAKVLVDKGEPVTAGQLLLTLDVEDRKAQLTRAGDLLLQRSLQYEAAQKLARQGLMSELELATAKANLSAARAEIKKLESELAQTQIRAPFAGVVEARPLEVGDFAHIGDLLASVIDPSRYLVVGHVSEDDIAFLQSGQPGRAVLSGGAQVSGRLHFIAAQSDAASRTFRVELLVDNRDERLIVGTSASLMLPLEPVTVHIVEPGSLALNKDGLFGVKSVDAQSRVVFHPAQIAHNRDNSIWLTGLPDELSLITVGQGFVTAGDEVNAVRVPQ